MRYRAIYFLLLPTLLFGCTSERVSEQQEEGALYAISWYYPNSDYQQWIGGSDSTARFIELYSQPYSSIDSILATCSGLILTGGADIAPDRHNTIDSLALCGAINTRRDSIELKALDFAKRTGLPTLGVCRGMQIMNVSFGGNLILDLPTERGSSLHQRSDTDAVHMVFLQPPLRRILQVDSGLTNSNHHQAVRRLAPGLEAVAWSTDSVVEGIRHSDTLTYPYMWGVQWHPERMEASSPMSRHLLSHFINATQQP